MEYKIKICKEEGCNTKALARGLCGNHYKIQRQNGSLAKIVHPEKTGTCPCGKKAVARSSRCKRCNADIAEAKNKRMGLTCAAETCHSSRIYSDSMCQKHYQQVKRHGKVLESERDAPNAVDIVGDVCFVICKNNAREITAAVKIDLEDKDRVLAYRWHFDKSTGYARTLMETQAGRKHIGIHHLVMGVMPEFQMIDHRDGDKLNCIKANLRKVSLRQNCMNSATGVGFGTVPEAKGVYYDKNARRYVANINVKDKKITKSFQSKQAAIAYRKVLADKYQGQYAYENRSEL